MTGENLGFTQIGLIIFGLVMVWIFYGEIKTNKSAFSAKNINKSAYTMGLLSLGLIGFIAACIYILRLT